MISQSRSRGICDSFAMTCLYSFSFNLDKKTYWEKKYLKGMFKQIFVLFKKSFQEFDYKGFVVKC